MDPQRRSKLNRLIHAHALAMPDRAVSLADKEVIDTEWFSLGTYTEALKLNRLFIMGQRKASIYCRASLDPESKDLIPGLLDLHKYGLLTHDSQPFQKSHFKGESGGEFLAARRQRPYIGFLLPTVDCISPEQIQLFWNNLLDQPEIVVRIWQHDGKLFCTNACENYVLTQSKAVLTILELLKEPWGDIRRIPSKEISKRGISWDVKALENAKCLAISVASRSWEDNVNLVELVKNAAIMAGMSKIYPL
ncbi:MAG: hypothetical protein Q9174_002102 [Haloplaca sp. 1 TL-2023]